MKVFTPDLKLVEELTKYIRPQEIERARFKKFNAPVINDGNLACDEFFRTEELFDRRKDVVVPYTQYSIGDVPVIDRTSPLARDLRTLEGSNSVYIESDLPYYVDIIGEKKRIYLENYGTKSPKHPHEADFDASSVWFGRKYYEGCSVDDVVNIRYYAKKLMPNDPRGVGYVEIEALKLLHDGYPIEGVINIMKKAATKGNGVSPAAIRFIADYPQLRRYMITYDCFKNEVFDDFGARMFPKLLETCGGDEKLAHRILCDCRAEMRDGSFLTHPELLTLGQKLYKADNVWSPEKAKIVQLVSLREPKYYKQYATKALQLQQRFPLSEVINKVMPKNNSLTERAMEIL